jgi:hypothetical protein
VKIFNRDDIHFASGYPCTVSEVKSDIGLMPGDILLQVNDINVSRTQAKAVQKLMKFVVSFIYLFFVQRKFFS